MILFKVKTKQTFSWSDTDLQLVLVVGVSCRKVSELLRQSETVPHVLRGHKILRRLDTAVQVVYLKEPRTSVLLMHLFYWNILGMFLGRS